MEGGVPHPCLLKNNKWKHRRRGGREGSGVGGGWYLDSVGTHGTTSWMNPDIKIIKGSDMNAVWKDLTESNKDSVRYVNDIEASLADKEFPPAA